MSTLSAPPYFLSVCLKVEAPLPPHPCDTVGKFPAVGTEERTMSGFLFTEEGWEWWGIMRVCRSEKPGSQAEQRSGLSLSSLLGTQAYQLQAMPSLEAVCASLISQPSPLLTHPLCTHLCTVMTGLLLCHSIRMALAPGGGGTRL